MACSNSLDLISVLIYYIWGGARIGISEKLPSKANNAAGVTDQWLNPSSTPSCVALDLFLHLSDLYVGIVLVPVSHDGWTYRELSIALGTE